MEVNKMENEITLGEALNVAVKKHHLGQLREAEIIYKKILEKYPANANALHLLGLIDYQKKDYESAVNRIQEAIKIQELAKELINMIRSELEIK